MKNTTLIIVTLLSAIFFLRGTKIVHAYGETKNQNLLIEKKVDYRHGALQRFFNSYRSELSFYVDDFIESADEFGVDWKVLPIISMVESGGCRQYIRGTYNCFGWGGGRIKFNGFEDAISTIIRTLSSGKAYLRFQKEGTLEAVAWGYNRSNWQEYTNKLGFFERKLNGIYAEIKSTEEAPKQNPNKMLFNPSPIALPHPTPSPLSCLKSLICLSPSVE